MVFKVHFLHGSGMQAPIVQIIRVQGTSSGGGACYINVGIHLDFLTFNNRPKKQPRKLYPTECMLYERMGYGRMWPYTKQRGEQMVEYYCGEYRGFLTTYRRFPDAFVVFTPEELLQEECSLRDLRGMRWEAEYVAHMHA